MSLKVRSITASDEPAWRALWEGYCAFYGEKVAEVVTQHTWSRIMDPASSVNAIVAELPVVGVMGMATYVLHENTWNLTPGCYLEDLYVAPEHRAAGAGQAMIDSLKVQMHEQGWSRLYWHTQENNYRARGLYDKYTPHSGAVRYMIRNTEVERPASKD